ncbi:MAG: LptF/LptG family permease, partial [Leptospiraceae bacterium]|nr:LptF/LptG family permease [Leptospiraceae bacterium]
MDLLDRYILKYFLKSLFGSTLLLTGIGLIAKVNETLKDILGFKGSGWIVVQYYALSLPTFVTFIIPPALMFSVAYTIAMFRRNNEISVILAAGRSFRRILRPLVWFSIILSFLFLAFNEFVSFPFAYKAYDTRNIILGRTNWREIWHNKNISVRFKDRFYTMGQIDLVNKKIDNLHYLELTKDGRPSLILEAESARFNQGKWLLTSGSQIQFVNEGSVSVKDSFSTRAYTLKESYEDLAAVHGRNTGADERSIFLIQELMDARKKTGGDYHFLETEFFWHLGYPFICFFVTYIGGNMGSRMRHGGVAVSIALPTVFT